MPKYHFDLETGELTGERNGVYATNLEHKMGIKASTTCEMTFGDGAPAVGWLLGEVHDGIAQMFKIIEHARMLVGTKAIATLSTGYLNALEYAKTRVQGADLTRAADKTAPRVTITHHPDVRRSLMTQKAFAEGLRALVLFTASIQDRVDIARATGVPDEAAVRLNDLLLPIVKGYGSERSWVLLGTESLQTYGGSGYLTDYPIEQYVRDAKIDTLYEGTTAIQGQDLFFRKIVRDQGQALGDLSEQIGAGWLRERPTRGDATVSSRRSGRCCRPRWRTPGAIVAHMVGDLTSSATGGDPRQIYLVGLNTTRLLMALGDVTCGWLLLRGAEVALHQLNTELPASEKAFYEGKVASARWFARTVLPKLSAERAIAEADRPRRDGPARRQAFSTPEPVSLPFPSPTTPRSSRADTLLAYLDYFRSVVLDKLDGLDDADLRTSRLPSGWTPLELLQHLVFVERRWLVWGFLGRPMADPWEDRRDDRWHVDTGVRLPDLVAALHRAGRGDPRDRRDARPGRGRSAERALVGRAAGHPGAGPAAPAAGVRPARRSPGHRAGDRRRPDRRVVRSHLGQ